MKKLILRTTLASTLLLGGATAFAQPGGEQNEAHEQCAGKRGHKNMSPEQKEARKAKRAERRAKFESMTPEQQKAHVEARKAKRAERLAKMSPEQRAKVEARRAKRDAKREARRGI